MSEVVLTDDLIDSLMMPPMPTQEKQLDPFRENMVKLSIQITNFVNACATYEMSPNVTSQQKLKIKKIFCATIDFIHKWSDPRIADTIIKQRCPQK